jgi:dTDP-D-glucose 4,6-dehydratase
VQRQPIIEQAQAALGWKPSTPLADGLARTVEYFRSLTSLSADQVYDLSRDQTASAE